MSYEVWGEPDEHDCSYCEQLIGERDEAQEAADRLAQCVADMLGVEIGEHSNLNDPWKTAAEYGEAVVAGRAVGTKREVEAIRLLQAICDAARMNHNEKPWPVKYVAPFGQIAEAMKFLQSTCTPHGPSRRCSNPRRSSPQWLIGDRYAKHRTISSVQADSGACSCPTTATENSQRAGPISTTAGG